MIERLGILGSGAIACGLAAVAGRRGPVVVWARSESSAGRARARIEKLGSGLPAAVDPATVEVTTERDQLAEATFLVEAITESLDVKSAVLRQLGEDAAPEAIIASTTSSLSIGQLAAASGRPERFCGLHVFNPVTKMALVELVFPTGASEDTRARARALCVELGKTAVEVPDEAGFVVNRLLFPYLFDAVRLLERTGMAAADIDQCMKLGAGHPMGPLALLDLVGLDVSLAIGETIDTEVPDRVRELIAEGALGRKTKRGFHDYS
ncbi:MAG: 3-hydroxybutyryl-CoA dehydrogenase [Solirubrobacteraceae bacterium]|nr:3-hydroxybutyryl-CoA dehydrogenase [Solirubrobacteraceae bacterium]